MAKSFLASQIIEIRQGLSGLAGDLRHLGDVNSQLLARRVGVQFAAPGGPVDGGGGGGAGGGGPTRVVLVDPTGRPIDPYGGGDSGAGGMTFANPNAPTGGAGGPGWHGPGWATNTGVGMGDSIGAFLAARESGKGDGMSSSGAGGGGGERTEVPATPGERAIMATLGEGVGYVRDLVKAATWARLNFAMVLRSPKTERDALIAAWKEDAFTSGKSSGGSGSTVPPRDPEAKYHAGPNFGNPTIFIGGSDPGFGGGGGTPDRSGGGGGVDVQGGAPTFNDGYASQSGPMAAPTAGDKYVATAVDKVTTAIDKLANKIDSQGGIGFRKLGLT